MNDKKIRAFTALIAWQVSHKLVLAIYKETKSFPKTEDYGLTSQMRRAAVSITSNLAEGFGRTSKLDKDQFYVYASASLSELRNQMIIARDIGLIQQPEFDTLASLAIDSQKLIHGLRRSHNRHFAQKTNSN